MSTGDWVALVLAAGRGPEEPMAKAYGVANKCTIPVAGVPMLARVVGALRACRSVTVSIEREAIVGETLKQPVATMVSARSAPASVLAALASGRLSYPVLCSWRRVTESNSQPCGCPGLQNRFVALTVPSSGR